MLGKNLKPHVDTLTAEYLQYSHCASRTSWFFRGNLAIFSPPQSTHPNTPSPSPIQGRAKIYRWLKDEKKIQTDSERALYNDSISKEGEKEVINNLTVNEPAAVVTKQQPPHPWTHRRDQRTGLPCRSSRPVPSSRLCVASESADYRQTQDHRGVENQELRQGMRYHGP